MKKLSLLFVVLALGGTPACKKDSGAKAPAPKPGDTATGDTKAAPAAKPLELTEKVDIGAAVLKADPDDSGWNGITIAAPKGAVIDTAGGSPSLVIDDHMSVGLGGEKDLAEKRQQAQDDQLQKFARFVVDEPDAILWEGKSTIDGSSNFLLVVNVKLGDKTKSCTTDGYGSYTQANAEAVLKACRGMARN